MSISKDPDNPNEKRAISPPGFAQGLLSFFLPARLREPVLGDLEEEFTCRLTTNQSHVEAYGWYWRQALASSSHFFWKQRGNVMAYLISVIFFGLIFGLGVATVLRPGF